MSQRQRAKKTARDHLGPRRSELAQQRKAARDLQPNPMRLYRTYRLARLFDVDPATIWRWKQEGILPPPAVKFPGFEAWTEQQIAGVIAAQGVTNA